MDSPGSNRTIKLVAVGDGVIGKTCMLISYAEDRFPEDYIPTVFDNHLASVMWNNQIVNLSLYDTAGQEDYDQLRHLAYPNTDVFLLCFSLVDPASYNNVISKWAPELKKHCPDTPILLVGTKLDCREDERSLRELARRNEHPIMNDDGLLLKKQIGAFDYIECSARTGKNLKYVFTRCIEQVIGAQLSDEQKTKRRSKNLVQKIFSKKHKCTVM